ncbi:myosin-binding protein 2-like isoform X2 [Phragmites australis]|uniref:myosin-binding protein 2-like isoform X2 n=1 Tax=Phragmites australis TaxID=29695 RepID=UPI002D77DDDD|nr:myosin-binding protein 2-like isoform X2 [Phragmites australis]
MGSNGPAFLPRKVKEEASKQLIILPTRQPSPPLPSHSTYFPPVSLGCKVPRTSRPSKITVVHAAAVARRGRDRGAAMAAAAGKLAAALHRRTHRVTSALAYAVLEWVLIALLLINGLLAYAIARFAAYFGLTPPCLLCSSVDRLFQEDGGEAGGVRWLRGVLCGAHAAEISALGYCVHHRRLVGASGMCEGCLSSWKEMTSDAGEKSATACSCCNGVLRTSLRELEDKREEHAQEKITEEEEDQGYVLLAQEDHEEEEEELNEIEMQEQQSEVEGQEQQDEKVTAVEDESLEVMVRVEEIAPEDDRLVPVVALDEMTIADGSGLHRDVEEEEDDTNRVDDEQDSRDVDIGVVLEEKRILDSSVATPADAIEDSAVLISPIPRPEIVTNPSDPDQNSIPHDDEDVPDDTVEIGDSTTEEEHILPQVTEAVSEDDNRSAEVDTNCEVSIGSDICEREQDEHVVPFQDSALEDLVAPLAAADDQPLPLEILAQTEQASETEQEEVTDATRLNHLPNEQNEAEDDKAPETPTYGVATQRSDRMFLLERKRSLSLSLDGSVASEVEGGEPSTVDQLKSALQAERKALGALYAELEEERNAAAIATNQTMAMINRLQEEKAAMQMEALQYQRMMEEQSEYDQEALQLLNELVTKREREKQELERELELFRQKVQHYEDKERRRTASFKANGVSTSCSGTSVSSSGEDSDEHSDDYCELGESPHDGNIQSSSDAALSSMTGQDGTRHLVALDDSLTYFEIERLSILEELKALEERLFTLEDDDINTTSAAAGHSSDDIDLSADGLQSPEYGLTDDKAKYRGRTSISRGKSLLPLFDAVGDENGDQMPSARVEEGEAVDSTTKSVSVVAKEQERLAIIEEVDHVYERLQALEADKEFLRHCIKSLKKGEKGMDLLQEILQHLRDLRNVELHVKNAGDALAANSA